MALFQECETLRELAAGPDASGWGPDAETSCIFETVPGSRCSAEPHLRSSYASYKSVRTSWPLRQAAWDVLFASQLTRLVTAVLGPAAHLFNDQYISKPGRSGPATAFAWHRDSDWCRDGAAENPGYLSVWAALDDVFADNGCLVIRPGSHAQNINSQAEGPRKDVLAQPEVVLELPAGSAVVMVDGVEHASGPNTSAFARRAWMPQFSAQPILWEATGLPVSLAIPLSE